MDDWAALNGMARTDRTTAICLTASPRFQQALSPKLTLDKVRVNTSCVRVSISLWLIIALTTTVWKDPGTMAAKAASPRFEADSKAR
jgi:hypothetical protein